MVNSKYAMTTICNILMNLVVLENKVVEDAHIFYHLLKFIMNTLPSLENNGEVRYQVSLSSSLHYIELNNCCRSLSCMEIWECWVFSYYRNTPGGQSLQITQYSDLFRSVSAWNIIDLQSTQHVLLRPWWGSCGMLTTARRPGRRRSWWSPLPTLSTGMIW